MSTFLHLVCEFFLPLYTVRFFSGGFIMIVSYNKKSNKKNHALEQRAIMIRQY